MGRPPRPRVQRRKDKGREKSFTLSCRPNGMGPRGGMGPRPGSLTAGLSPAPTALVALPGQSKEGPRQGSGLGSTWILCPINPGVRGGSASSVQLARPEGQAQGAIMGAGGRRLHAALQHLSPLASRAET